MDEPKRPSKKRRLSKAADEGSQNDVSGQQQSDLTRLENASNEQRRTIFVRSLAPETSTEALAEHFSQSYPIKHAVAVLDREKKLCKGYGFVTFTDPEDALQACKEYNGSELLSKKVKVEIAEARHREEGEDNAKSVSKRGSKQAVDAQENHPPPRLIVRNLPWSMEEPDQLANLFRSYGKIKHVSIPKKGNKMIGFGVVLIRGHKNAEKAIAGINGKEVEGRTLAVDWAVDRDTWQHMKSKTGMAGTADAQSGTANAPQDNESPNATTSRDLGFCRGGSDSEGQDQTSHDGTDASSDLDGIVEQEGNSHDDNSTTIFVRNLPFSCTDEDLYTHFRRFGPLRYARVVYDPSTERPRGTGFVCFVAPDVFAACLKRAPKGTSKIPKETVAHSQANSMSVLQDENLDPSGDYTMEGRVLQVSQAVGKSEAAKLTAEGHSQRNARDQDKRRLYLLSEGTIDHKSELYKKLSPSELAMRDASMKQRRSLIQSNPSLHLSLTRLSVRNIPRSVNSKDLKNLAREAVVGFATDVKAGLRQQLSKEERLRGFNDMKAADHDRRVKHKGIVKQAKVIFEGREGSKVKESEGAGRSRGYGFIEYYTHRSALMGLRWLNGHAVAKSREESLGKQPSAEDLKDRKRRLIVEFAIENAQVVGRRREREVKARSRDTSGRNGSRPSWGNKMQEPANLRRPNAKRKRDNDAATHAHEPEPEVEDAKLAKRNRIISKKRMARRTRKNVQS